ncbi:hypothetical protein ACJU26_08735 [Acidithiobacillus sp. M4-SHS-6]|uniref:hypothetical protein n=1 Tax=Acidithiobacillus sp. M4-SHS-6 TaxID=3383024 RepID=UPI0039BE0122
MSELIYRPYRSWNPMSHLYAIGGFGLVCMVVAAFLILISSPAITWIFVLGMCGFMLSAVYILVMLVFPEHLKGNNRGRVSVQMIQDIEAHMVQYPEIAMYLSDAHRHDKHLRVHDYEKILHYVRKQRERAMDTELDRKRIADKQEAIACELHLLQKAVCVINKDV